MHAPLHIIAPPHKWFKLTNSQQWQWCSYLCTYIMFFFCFRCHYACSDKFKSDEINTPSKYYHAPCNPDDESQESQETTRQPRTTRTRTTTMMYARGRGGSGGNASKKSTGSCPGSLEDCFAACPGANVRVYRLCTADCSRRCSKK